MSETRRRNHIVMVRVDDEELAEVTDRARSAGMSKPSYLRRAALSKRIDHATKSTAECLRELSRIGQNLNQLTRLSHLGKYNREDVLMTLSEVRQVAARLVGKDG